MKTHYSIARAAVALAALAAATPALAVPVMDGTADAEYGEALSTQNTNTQFGDAVNGDPINGGGGSEIDQVFARISGGRLYVLIAGNLETNFNKLDVFIDSEAGAGVNSIDGSALPRGVDPFSAGGFPTATTNPTNIGAMQRMSFLTFDAGFNADHYLTFTGGFERLRQGLPDELQFFAATAHYADLTDGTAGRKGALGMQLAQRGLPNVLRGTTADFDIDGDADGSDFLIWQRNVGAANPSRLLGNADGDDNPDPNVTNLDVDGDDLNILEAAYGFRNDTAGFDANYFAPQSQGVDDSDVLLGPTLPGLAQGDLIDKVYATTVGQGSVSPGVLRTRELEFTLPVDAGDPENTFKHRDMENIVDLQLAVNNSNTVGVTGAGPYNTPTTGNPGDVTTGIEFSIPLSEIGYTSGAIKLMAFINNGEHNFLANQVSGTGILMGNIGNLMPDFELEPAFAGTNQFVTIPAAATPAAGAIPEPGAMLLASMAAVAALGVARRRL